MTEKTGRGWGGIVALALVTTALSVVHPALVIFVPLGLLLIGLPPRRPVLVAIGVALAAAGLLWTGGETIGYVERGWVFLLGAWFLVLAAAWPQSTFLGRAIGALAASMLTAAAVLITVNGGWEEIDFAVASRLRAEAAEWAWIAGSVASRAGSSALADRLAEAAYSAADLTVQVYPSLLALSSLAGLAVAWWGYRRLAAGERLPLRPLREFRFDDHLVWLVILGIVLVILPLGAAWVRAGSNVLLFMGALYALRGLAVLVALAGAPGPLGVLLGVLALVFLYPLVLAGTMMVGLTDTWLDLRRRKAALDPGG